MKRVQAANLKILTAVFVFACTTVFGSPNDAPNAAQSQVHLSSLPEVNLKTADSLFHLKQYTQSLEIYDHLFSKGTHSPSMLLKMAYIQEGLGHVAQSMYYLNLYYLATSDRQALVKIEEVASKNKLAGYEESDTSKLWSTLRENQGYISGGLAAACMLLLALMFYQKTKKKIQPIGAAIGMVLLLMILGLHTYLANSHGQGIIAASETYLMSGPSAGSSVVSIVGEGHRLDILSKKDVWLKVKWHEREVFVKSSELLPVRL